MRLRHVAPLAAAAAPPPVDVPVEQPPRSVQVKPPFLVAAMLIAAIMIAVVLSLRHSTAARSPDTRTARGPSPTVGTAPAATMPPVVEPVVIKAMTPDAARAANAAVPFADVPLETAPPFHFVGTTLDRERATDCLAAVDYYEAGTSITDQVAVAQVVINRLRHPAFPKTVCGVIFQGADRPTGCQFTFSCDGSLPRRTPGPADWLAARVLASSVLEGTIDRRVGMATHYHTDWVVPYWNASMLKIAKVQTHLFYRWPGSWGTRPAFHAPAAAPEPAIAALVSLSPAHLTGAQAEPGAAGAASAAAAAAAGRGTNFPAEAVADRSDAKGLDLRMSDRATGRFIAIVPASETGSDWALGALALCHGQDRCSVIGWRDPAKLPTTLDDAFAGKRMASFLFVRTKDVPDRLRWNCKDVKRPDAAQCL